MADNNTKIIISAVDNTRAAFNSVKSGMTQIQGAGNTLNGVMLRLAPFLGAATFAGILRGGIDTLDMLGDLSERTGVAASTLSGLQLAADLSDTSLEALGKGINKLSVYLAENSKAAAKLGITAKDPTEALIQLSDVISGIDDPQQRAAVANKFLGKSYQELLPLLLRGSDQLRELIERGQKYGGVTDEAVKQAGEFNDQLDIISRRAKSVGISFAQEMLPELNKIIGRMQVASEEAGVFKTILAGLNEAGTAGNIAGSLAGAKAASMLPLIGKNPWVIAGGAAAGGLLPEFFDDVGTVPLSDKALNSNEDKIKRYEVQIDRLRSLGAESEKIASIQKKIDALKASGNKPESKDKKPSKKVIKDFLGGDKNSKSNSAEVAIEAASQYAKLYGEFIKVIDGTKDLTVAEQTLADIQAGKFADLLPWQQEQLAGLANQVKMLADIKVFEDGEILAIETLIELENEKLDAEAKALEQQQLAADAYDKVLESISLETEELQFQLSIQGLSQQAQQEKIAARNVEIALQKTLNELADQGLGLSEEEIIALREKYGEIQKLNAQLNTGKNIARDIGLTFKSAFEDAIVEGKKLSEIFKGIEQDILRILVRRTVTEPLEKGITGLLDGFDFGSIFSGIFTANAKGNVYSGPGISAYSGSVVTSPTLFPFAKGTGLMGEAGAEGIFPLKRGKDGKLGVSAEGVSSGKTSVTLNIFNAPKNAEVRSRDDGNGNISLDVFLDGIKSALVKDIRSEGPFAQGLQNQYGLNRAAGAM